MKAMKYSKLKVLIVDDFSSFRLALNKMLTELGFRVIDSAGSGIEALNYCKKQHYDLILCDYNLGAGKNGQQLLEELRQDSYLKQQDIFILLSAETSRNVVMSAGDYEPDAYLTKPITNKSIEQRLNRLLSRRDEMLDILTLLQTGEKAEAIAPLKQKITSNSRYSMDCQKILAEIYIDLAEYSHAEKIYRNVLEMRPLNWAQVGLAQVRLASGDAETAAKWLQDIIKVNPTYMKAYDVLTQALRQLDDIDGVQKVLQQAVDISPLSLGRQESLAHAALENGDAEVSAKAYRKVIKHGENSKRNSSINHVNYGKSVAQLFDKDIEQAKHFSKDVLSIFSHMDEDNDVSEEQTLIGQLLTCQIMALKGEQSNALKLLEQSVSVIDEDNLGKIDVEIELVKAYSSSKRQNESKRLLDKMLIHYADNQVALEKIDHLLPEPASQKGKKILAKVNKNGISAYKAGDFLLSIDYFTKAEKRFPRYIGIKLNLVQALIGKLKTDDGDEMDVNRCNTILEIVKRDIQQNQPYQQRFLKLQEMLRTVAVG